MKLDLNCDLAEGESLAKTRALMRSVTSANVACGGHAGNVSTMHACVRLAKQFNVSVGAHPGVAANFGRGNVSITPPELQLLVLQQAAALGTICAAHRVRLHHIKLHGALYHLTEQNEDLTRAFLLVMRSYLPNVIIYARAGGRVAKLAPRFRLLVWEEAFIDRAYREDGSLVPRNEPGALISNLGKVAGRVQQLVKSGVVESIDGAMVPLRVQTLYVHSDTPGSSKIAAFCQNVISGRL